MLLKMTDINDYVLEEVSSLIKNIEQVILIVRIITGKFKQYREDKNHHSQNH